MNSPSRSQPVSGAVVGSEPSAAFTPGPWTYSKRPSLMWHIRGSDAAVCFTAAAHSLRGDAKNAANARLIAAAPDLLEALSWFINDIDGSHTVMLDFDAAVERARAAIAKATGLRGGA